MINPIDQELPKKISEIEKRLYKYEVARNVYQGDWYTLTEPVEFVSVDTGAGFREGVIKFKNPEVEIRRYLAPGQMIRYKQTTIKYAYITDIAGSTIKIYGGDDYILANAPVEEFSKAIVSVPTGHPIKLKYNPQLTALGATFTQGALMGLDYRFSMAGPDVLIYAYDLGGSSVNAACVLEHVLPIKAVRIETGLIRLLNGAVTIGLSYVNNGSVSVDPSTKGVYFREVTETSLASGSANHQGNYSYHALLSV